ncbi:hypothetical protein CHS0354_007004 [Potamilus streckersoni]|uniref:Uncharacterized protein n=1 Tax=Potamilus streckersoni TaxID=2493646 RepID=A0AAE0RX90_9BIVA|nr:hypothetical protein CHS0354_007004 [Potamilus streckersoni]
MPVYVTHAHITLGESRDEKRQAARARLRSQVGETYNYTCNDIYRTPYICRSCLVTTIGMLILLGGGFVTLVGFRPGFLEDATSQNLSSNSNVSVTTEGIPVDVSGLNFLTYIGPVLMGIGFFLVMMSVVLFCEIKDRFTTAIGPSTRNKNITKNELYDKLIEEFRKNYFRGIEVPIRRRSSRKKVFPFTGNTNHSEIKIDNRESSQTAISPEIVNKKRRLPRRTYSERSPNLRVKRIRKGRLLEPDSWMKTVSLPNIGNRGESYEMQSMFGAGGGASKPNIVTHGSCVPKFEIFQISGSKERVGLDNPAFKGSPTERRKLLSKSPSTSMDNSHSDAGSPQSTVMVHTAYIHNEDSASLSISIPLDDSMFPDFSCSDSSVFEHDSSIGLEREIHIKCESSNKHIDQNYNGASLSRDLNEKNICICKKESEVTDSQSKSFSTCTTDASLSLSWESFPNESVGNEKLASGGPHSSLCRSINEGDDWEPRANRPLVKSLSLSSTREYVSSFTGDSDSLCSKREGIGFFRSESCLDKIGYYSVLAIEGGTLSIDSIELSDGIMKNFEMAEMAYV